MTSDTLQEAGEDDVLLYGEIEDDLHADDADNDMSELDDLLAEAMGEAKARKDLADARKKLRNPTTGLADRSQTAADIARWEALLEWQTQANVAVFHKQVCLNCWRDSYSFRGFMLRQVHRTKPATSRWVRVKPDSMDQTLPNETWHEVETTTICFHCIAEHGFSPLEPAGDLSGAAAKAPLHE